MLDRSRYVLGLSSDETTPVPTVRAYGEQDDHLRLTVLLATFLGDRVDPELRETCTRRDTPWKRRCQALKDLLGEAQAKSEGMMVRLIDPDALDMGELTLQARWQDTIFKRERSQLFSVLLDSFTDGGWELVRPEPRALTTGKLDERDCAAVAPPPPRTGMSADEERLEAVAETVLLPAVRPLADGLVANGHLRARDMARLIEAASSPSAANDVVLLFAYDVLSMDAIETGKRLSVLRGPQRWNGGAGPFELSDEEDGWTRRIDTVYWEAVDELIQGGWLEVRTGPEGGRRFAMANTIRCFLRQHAAMTEPQRVREEHELLARRPLGSLEENVEIHYHAVESGDDSLARSTARYYGSDLRRIAYSLSTRKDPTRSDFERAAGLYRTIVREFDAGDAYAWEYLGYNLAMQYRDAPLPADVAQEISEAYANASKHDPTNPLYKGREIGFQARLGRRVDGELSQWLKVFRRTGGEEGLVIFAQRVLDGMSTPALLELAGKPWATDLMRHPELGRFFR